MKNLTVLFFLFYSVLISAQSKVKNVDAETFKNYLERTDVVLLDLRTDSEIARKGKIKGAKQIDFFKKEAEKQILELDKEKIYLIYCAGGGRSSDCGELMEKNGFKSIVNLDKGFDDWKKKGFETEQE